jgi:cellulose synthase/poly-beta-1,6-N-acetylglucosamine synthase-like glycosyltransferase
MIIVYITILLLLIYSILIVYYALAWKSIPGFEIPDNYTPNTKLSVIIPTRNEEKNIGSCLYSLAEQDYPSNLFEVIIVNDYSTDRTAEIIQSFSLPNFKLINLQDEPSLFPAKFAHKKKAIETGVVNACGELIITTDADCFFDRQWLKSIASYYDEKRPVFIAAPVALHHENSAIKIFQSLDFLSLQGITGASVHKKMHTMCNGANLAYERKVFLEVGGFTGIDDIASGDDMMLMYKIYQRYPGKVLYLKSQKSIVYTNAVETIKEFFQQRIRWASKASKYHDKTIVAVLLVVYLLNFFLLALLVFSFFVPSLWVWFGSLVLIKFVIELAFLIPVTRFFSKRKLLWFFLPAQPFHLVYTVIAGFLGQTGGYEWKGRRVR